MFESGVSDSPRIMDIAFQGAAAVANSLSSISFGRSMMLGLAGAALTSIATSSAPASIRNTANVSIEILGSSVDNVTTASIPTRGFGVKAPNLVM
jgi:hypothetical protein